MGSKDKKKSKENKQKKQEINKDKSKKKEEKENKQKKQETNKDKSNKKEKKEKEQKKLEKKEKNKNEKKIKKEIEKELHEILEKDDKKAEILGLTNDMMDPMTLSKAFLRISTKEDGKGATQESIERILKAYDLLLSYRTKYHFGYPYNLSFEHEELFPFLRFSINNLGDPFVESNYGVHSRMFELEVLDYYASIWKIDKKAYWGYVTCSGTEGNLHGLYVGRECLNNPILYASIESHYSVFKAARFYKIDVRPIPTQRNGQIDYEKFETELKNNLDRDVLLNANIGTTVKGAIDDVDKLIDILEKNNFTEKNTFIHCDGALFGLMVPFLSGKFPEINFTKKMIKSVSVSGHKFLGCPMPCGVVIHRKDNIKRIETPIPYLNSVDTTIMGSRNGQASLFMWLSLKKKGTEGIKKDVERCCEYSREFAKLLDKHNISHMLNEESNTIVMVKPPSDNFVKKWQLACVDTIAHAIVMPSTTLEKISVFVEEMVSVMESLDWPDICVESHIGDHCRCKKCKN